MNKRGHHELGPGVYIALVGAVAACALAFQKKARDTFKKVFKQ